MKITMEKTFKPLDENDEKKRKKSVDVESSSFSRVADIHGDQIPAPLMSNSSRSVSNTSSASSSSSASSASSTVEKLLCGDCNSCLCPKCLKTIVELEERENSCNALYCVSAFRLGLRRVPALLVTLVLELAGGFVIDALNESIRQFIVLASFMPVISALSGNLGLQSSSNTTRGLSTGNVVKGGFMANTWKEVKSGFLAACIISLLLGLIGAAWAYLGADEPLEAYYNEVLPTYPFIFGGVVMLGSFLSMLISTINGAVMPLVAHYLRLDPAKVAGPLETAFQDIFGQSFLLGFAMIVLIPLFRDINIESANATTTETTTTMMMPMSSVTTTTIPLATTLATGNEWLNALQFSPNSILSLLPFGNWTQFRPN